jgi:AraC-like DNA-binding protein
MATTSTTLTSWALLIWKVLQANGYDAHSLFKRVGVDSSQLGDGNARYRLSEMTKLWAAAVDETNNPCFGIEVGKIWNPTTFHALGFAWLASHSLKDALQRLARYSRIVNNSLSVSLEPHGTHLHFIMDTSEEDREVHYAARDAGLVAVVKMCRMLCGDSFSPVEIHVARERSSCGDMLEKFVGAPITYSSEKNLTLFDRMQAEQRLATGNSELAKVNEEVALKYLTTVDKNSIVMLVKSKLIELMPEGQITEDRMADQLNMSLRTLQRRLADENTSFSDIYKSIRQELAGEFIQDSQMSMSEIAYLLGFSEQSNFTRAFRRWYGTSPSEARENLKKVSVA